MTALAVTANQTTWDDKQIAALKQVGLENVPKPELAVFLHYCQRTGLDPFARQIYMINRGAKYTIQASIDGLRIVAQRSGNYGGQTAPMWCGEDGEWKEVWTSKEPPIAAKIGVYYKDSLNPTWGIAKFESYAVYYNGKLSNLWAKMPDLMIAKCAEALALRKAFPNDLSGIYTDDEMNQADNTPEPIKVSKIDLHVVKQEGKEPKHVDWDSLLPAIDALTDVDTAKKLWNARKEILDEIVPDTSYTIRDLLLAKVEQLNATTN